MFFADKPGPHTGTAQNTPHLYRAFRLREAVHRTARLRTHYSMRAWAAELALLEKEVGARRLDLVLTWFCANAGRPGVPRAMGGKSFRRSFGYVEQCMRKDKANTMDVHPLAEAVVRQVSHLYWPKGSQQDLLRFVGLTLANYAAFRTNLRMLKVGPAVVRHHNASGGATFAPAPQPTPFVNWLRESMPDAPAFAVRWCQDVHAGISNWEAWSGLLVPLAFRLDPDNPRTDAWGRGLAEAHCGAGAVWHKFVRKYPQVFEEV